VANTQTVDAAFRFALKALGRSRQLQTCTARARDERSCKPRLRAPYLQRGGSGALTMVQILACTASMYTPVSL
jgi:hypothetical protein